MLNEHLLCMQCHVVGGIHHRLFRKIDYYLHAQRYLIGDGQLFFPYELEGLLTLFRNVWLKLVLRKYRWLGDLSFWGKMSKCGLSIWQQCRQVPLSSLAVFILAQMLFVALSISISTSIAD